MYTITVSEKGGQQSTFEFNKPEITIGRMKGNDIVLPKGNEADLDDLPAEVREQLEFVLVDRVDQVFETAFGNGAQQTIEEKDEESLALEPG